MRIGIGYDIHRFKEGRELWLGGVKLDHPLGLDGHSDADVLLHAIIDAMLGAAGLPDIGHYFPPGDPATKGLPSSRMLDRVLSEVSSLGYHVGNVDCNIITETPKLKPYSEAIRKNVAHLLRIPASDVSIKAKTNETCDAIGEKLAMSAQAVVLLLKN